MPPGQLVDVPVPQAHERSSRSLLYERGKSLLEGLHRRQEAEEAARFREQIALLEEEEMDEDEEEEEVTSVLVAGAGTCLLAASALTDGSAPLHTMSLSSIQTHGSACGGGWLGLSPGAWHPLTPSWVPSVVRRTTDHGSCGGGAACAFCGGTDRGMPVPQITPVRGGGQLVRRTSTDAVLGQGC